MRVGFEKTGAGSGWREAEAGIIPAINFSEGVIQMLKTVLSLVGVLLFLAGFVWFLQGVNILPGSFMTGNPQWAINGAIAMVIGGGMFWFARKR